VRIERTQDAKLRVQGAGSIHVDVASGDLELDLPGAGSIEVEKGQVRKLSATLNGAGDIRFGGTATTARLQADGAGSIRVHRVVQKPTVINNAAGEIVVENGG
jgi:Putative auto-transporter adhesin, head GIN domain